MSEPLRCRDLRPGDILLKLSDGSLISTAIRVGQSLTGGLNPHIVHAGVMFDSTYIIEAQGDGVSANDLRLKNRGFGYYVYRSTDPALAEGAGTCAKMLFDIHQGGRNLRYGLGGAIRSLFARNGRPTTPGEMDALLDRILEGQHHPFFCSQFVVYVFQFCAEQSGMAASRMFNVADAAISPSVLAALLQGHYAFVEAGYLMPNER
jgi:hypothetical protein